MNNFNNWQDWRNQGISAGHLIEMDIPWPPCAGCMFWNPSIALFKAGPDGRVGLVLDNFTACTAANMAHDFSCFRPKEVKK